MLANILNIPTSEQDLLVWSFSHSDAHTKINNAIFQQKNIPLQPYILDPMPNPSNTGEMQTWAYAHQAAHSAFEDVLNIGGTDLSSVDFTQPDQVASWIRLHFDSHLQAQQQLAYPD